MAFEMEQRDARRLLDGIELGSLSTADAFGVIEQTDPTLVYFIFTWLRSHYANHPAAEGVIGRIIEICRTYPAATRRMKQGEADPLVEWFEDTFEYRDLSAEEFIQIVVEKLES